MEGNIDWVSKGLMIASGLFGGLSLSFFWQPEKFHKRGAFMAGAMTTAIGMTSTFAIGGAVCSWLGLAVQDIDSVMAVGFAIGLSSVGVIGWISNFFDKREDMDIMQIREEFKKAKVGEKPVRKPVSATTTRRKRV
jgi:hypothetical protein